MAYTQTVERYCAERKIVEASSIHGHSARGLSARQLHELTSGEEDDLAV
jgi:hypothetical protein